jgi:cytochrome c oxidase subunit 2
LTVIAERFNFTPERLVVTQGDTVRLIVKSADGTHGIEIEKFDVDEVVPKGGKPVTVEFSASEAGTFPIVCSEYCGRGHERMKGVLEVRPAGGGAR